MARRGTKLLPALKGLLAGGTSLGPVMQARYIFSPLSVEGYPLRSPSGTNRQGSLGLRQPVGSTPGAQESWEARLRASSVSLKMLRKALEGVGVRLGPSRVSSAGSLHATGRRLLVAACLRGWRVGLVALSLVSDASTSGRFLAIALLRWYCWLRGTCLG